jgi:hypothetical protein
VCSTSVRAIAIAAVAAGCHAPAAHPTALPELAPPYRDPDFGRRIETLRATLARSSIALVPGADTRDTIEACVDEATCTRCDVATGGDGIDPELLDQIALAFAGYPPALVAAANIEHVVVCRRIRHTADANEPAGTADLSGHRMLISVEPFIGGSSGWGIGDVVHHELYHLFDFAQLGSSLTADPEWGALKPLGFEYRDPAPERERQPGFVNSYATTDELEDRASTYQFLMARSTELCAFAATDPIVAAKAALVWRRVAAIAGEQFLRDHAPCVDWIDDATFGPRRRPAATRSPLTKMR